MGRLTVPPQEAHLGNQVSEHALKDYQERHLTEHLLGRRHALVNLCGEEILSYGQGQAGNHRQQDGGIALHHVQARTYGDIGIEQAVEQQEVAQDDEITDEVVGFGVFTHESIEN